MPTDPSPTPPVPPVLAAVAEICPVPVEVWLWWTDLDDHERAEVSVGDLAAICSDPTLGGHLGVPHWQVLVPAP